MNGKISKGSGRGLIYVTLPAVRWQKWAKNKKFSHVSRFPVRELIPAHSRSRSANYWTAISEHCVWPFEAWSPSQ